MRILIFTLVLLLAWLQYRLWVGEGSLAEIHALKADIARQTEELGRLRARNQSLAAEVANLKAGNEALEERARMDLGMIKPGEVFLQVIPGRSAAPAHDPGQAPEQDPLRAPKAESKAEPRPPTKPTPKPTAKPAPPGPAR